MKSINWKAARTSLFLCLLFTIVYMPTNWLASMRECTGSVCLDFERRIPFVPLLIIPYMSIDLFFVAAPFLCRNDAERRTLASRIAAAILAAGTCFLLFPCKFSFDRPAVDGWLGAIFNHFREIDHPFNELPSLHIALCAILLPIYTRRFMRPWCVAAALWFLLIALSALLTFQHHTLDILGGLILAAFCFHLFPQHSEPAITNDRVGWYYTLGALIFIAGTFIARPWSWLLLWPALSLAWTATAYFGARRGTPLYRKSNGQLPLTTHLLLWPTLLGQHLSLLYYKRQCRAWDQLTTQVRIGRVPSDAEAQQQITEGVTAVLDLTQEFSEVTPFLALNYFNLPILDLTAPTTAQLDAALAFIRLHTTTGTVYIHCKVGYSRTAAIAGAYLLNAGAARTTDEALTLLRAARPTIVIRPEAIEAMRAYEARLAAHR